MLRDLSSELAGDRAVAVIPARGGSKGIPRKNLQRVAGVPLVTRAIKTCFAASAVSEVYVSTDDEEIGDVAAEAGAMILWRPPQLAGDNTASEDVLFHALNRIEKPLPAVMAFVQCTAPLLTPDDIDLAIARLQESGADVAIAAAEHHGFVVRAGYDDRIRGVGWELTEPVKRRQDMAPHWVIAGSVWAINIASFLERGRLYSENCVICPVARKLDIDEPADLELANLICRAETKRANEPEVYYPH
jgi:N-acylneuraminate cytidylyltransferase